MDIYQIETTLKSADSKDRLKAIAALKEYNSEVAVPLLTSQLQERDFLVRSFVAMGLGKQQTAESFAALLQLMKFDRDPNVRAEAANSLSLFGKVAASHLVMAFHQDDQWLVRRSILAALMELPCPEEIFDVCVCGLVGEDFSVREAVIDGFASLANSTKHSEALQQILALKNEEEWRIRLRVARGLKGFEESEAKIALSELRNDADHRVVGAALEGVV
ncbi:HEAT repeat domain-containing protein [Limnofasciculus baicalensis]|uniref:HEAT repeat domain-containing protein n=1 Tax=Limnofasciculus baicalensis BBK-W-15 TaxID=2699891 RepID=A0AAE3GPR5_9CYAN|nr:HEAT repeat domain-containing protein [Limnofasciculus baicalensis]MCP2728254.1 HEAT repeat domain-containing protein [Limnofasciculus baicalensis BBK-W-15]